MDNKNDYSELSRQARAIKAEAEACVERMKSRHRLYLRDLAGRLADPITSSRSEAEECLRHLDKNVRIAALQSMQDVLQVNDVAFRAVCEKMILHDPDEEVRAIAINCLAKCYEATNDQRLAVFFGGYVRDESLPSQMRTAAYFALLVVTGHFQRQPELILDFTFPEQVDWSFVNWFR